MTSVAQLTEDVVFLVAGEVAKRKREDRGLVKATEAQIQASIVRQLAHRAPKDCVWFHVPNGGSRHPIEARKLKGQGVMAGVPDLVIVHAGKIYGLELKSNRRGRLSRSQTGMHERMRAAGAQIATAWGVDEALDQLKAWGLLVR